jgi:hypothetical protein
MTRSFKARRNELMHSCLCEAHVAQWQLQGIVTPCPEPESDEDEIACEECGLAVMRQAGAI